MKKVLALVLIALIAITGVFAQGSSESSSGLEKVTVAYMANYASLWSVVGAMNSGAFADQGIEVQLVEFADGPTIIAAMESGSIDVGYIGHGAHKLCVNGQADIFCFSHVGNGDAVIGLKSHGVTDDPASLKGKSIGYASGTSSEQILKWTSAMTSGALDACASWSPSTFTILNNIGSDAFIISDNVTFSDRSASVASWIVMPEFAEENHDLLVRFTKALYAGMDYRAEHEDEVIGWVAEVLGVDFDTVYAQRGDAQWLTSSELIEDVKDGTVESLYEVQKGSFGSEVDPATPVSDYVLFDVMLEAAE